MTEPTRPNELRLALVLNGGVSLAVWISGVVHEVDRLRRAGFAAVGDTVGYHDALAGRTARVDVIAGASAGGINGALLAAAIQGGRAGAPKQLRADGRPLRDVWLQIGDLGKRGRPRTRRSRRASTPSTSPTTGLSSGSPPAGWRRRRRRTTRTS